MSDAARVLIHIDEQRRDAAVLIALARLFEMSGCHVVLSTRRTTPLLVRKVFFDAVLLPFIAPYFTAEEAVRFSARSKLYLLPTEGAIFGDWPLMIKFGGGTDPTQWARYIQATTRCFLWGPQSRRALQATGRFREEQLVVVGAPRMDVHLADPSAAERALHDPRSIGAITSLTLINSYHRLTAFEAVDQGRDGHGRTFATTRNVEDWYWMESAQVRIWLELFDECRRRAERLMVRAHPREHLEAYRSLHQRYAGTVRLDGQHVPFETWIERLGVLIGFNSTAFFEAIAAAQPAISLAFLMGPRLPEHLDGFVGSHYSIIDQLETPRSWDALFEIVERIRHGRWDGYRDEAKALLHDVCGYPRSTAALAAIVRTVLKDVKGRDRRRGAATRFAEVLGTAKSRALEYSTFTIRRERTTSAWFPLRLRRLARQLDPTIQRYLRAAAIFTGSPDTEERRSTEEGRQMGLEPRGAATR